LAAVCSRKEPCLVHPQFVDQSDFHVDRLFLGGFAVAWTGTSPLPLPLVPVAFARMLTADGPPREGLQPWQRSSSPRRPGQLYVADRYAMRPFGAASASGLVWAEPPTQWSRERGKGSVHVGSAAALPNLEMTMSCSWDIT
jgi:hypothetical protein